MRRDGISGAEIIKLMRIHHKTIRGLSESMHITLTRVREVRSKGAQGACFVQDWLEAITGKNNLEE